MREKNRKPIASYIKLPQFTTMNVIDGQAGVIIYSSLICYSLTIDNILNIIVLLILAGVTIVTLTGDNGLLQKAGEAKNTSDDVEIEEQIKLAYTEWQTEKLLGETESVDSFVKNRLAKTFENIEDVNKIKNSLFVSFSDDKIYMFNIITGEIANLTNKTKISKNIEENFVGYYADIDADGTVDGVIFADLLVGNTKGSSDNVGYNIQTVSANDLKDYYISKESHTDSKFGTKPVLSPMSKGEDRFYVMSLSDFTTSEYSKFYWYKNGYTMTNGNVTISSFGSGKANTEGVIEKWNKGAIPNGGYGIVDDMDIWKHIQPLAEEGWFIPSSEEWRAFRTELNTRLNLNYWTSTVSGGWSRASIIDFGLGGSITNYDMQCTFWVRLATTF